ncbi:MAG: fibrobacter succinogenes major paralogous domain-containing protein [Bacteroidota bacterium]
MKTPMKFRIVALTSMVMLIVVASSCEFIKNLFEDDDNGQQDEQVVDIDGNVYSTVIIGDQEWFAENLRTTKYKSGNVIPSGYSDNEWSNLSTGAYAIYSHSQIDGLSSDLDVLEAYGGLYNWYAVETGKLCPDGWRVPTDADWTSLIDYAGGESIAGGKLKSTRTDPDAHPRWAYYPNTNANDEYGFSALPGGLYRSSDGGFDDVGIYGGWWSATERDASYAWGRYIRYSSASVNRGSGRKEIGFSVRCVRDAK